MKAMTARDVLNRATSEADFQRQVIELAQLCGWRVAHFRTSQNARGDYRTAVAADGKGFPDLVLVKDGHLLFVELKTARGRLTSEQHAWSRELAQVVVFNGDVSYRLWRPSDWPEIERVLA